MHGNTDQACAYVIFRPLSSSHRYVITESAKGTQTTVTGAGKAESHQVNGPLSAYHYIVTVKSGTRGVGAEGKRIIAEGPEAK